MPDDDNAASSPHGDPNGDSSNADGGASGESPIEGMKDEYVPPRHFVTTVEAELQEELEERSMRKGSVESIELDPPDQEVPLLRDGVITFLVGVPGSRLLDRIREAAKEGDMEFLRYASDALTEQRRRVFKPKTMDLSVQDFSDVPAFVELRYAEKTLAHGVFATPTNEVAEAPVLWNGAEIKDESLTYVEHVRDPDLPETEVLALRVRPERSELEQAISDSLSDEEREASLQGSPVAFTGTLVRVVARAFLRNAARRTPRFRQFARFVKRDQDLKEQIREAGRASAQSLESDEAAQFLEATLERGFQQAANVTDDLVQNVTDRDAGLETAENAIAEIMTAVRADAFEAAQEEGAAEELAEDLHQDRYYARAGGRGGRPSSSLTDRIQEGEFASLDSTASARKLLALRRELIRESSSR